MKRSVTKTKPAFTILSRLHEHKHRLLNDTSDDLNHSIGQALGQGPKKLDLRCNDLRLTNIQSLKNQIILRSEVVMVEILRVQHPQGHDFWGC